jgi:signal transduction histidine kinase
MHHNLPPDDDLEPIRNRIREKLANYIRYNFSQTQNNILKMFFDLAQELVSMADLYRICVVVPHELMQVDCSMYLLDLQEKHLMLVCDSRQGLVVEKPAVPTGVYLAADGYEADNRYVVPIYRKSPATDTSPSEDFALPQHKSMIMGMFVVEPAARLDGEDRFFLNKYANRIGYRLHNRQIVRQNIRHLKFINSLVMDIEHNVIIPNMYFRHLFNQVRKKILAMEALENWMQGVIARRGAEGPEYGEILKTITALRKDFLAYNREMEKHHANMSLFLESLFRREHFERGHLVLRPKQCVIEKKIIIPQLDQYRSRLKARNITIEQPADMAGEEVPLVVDVGLLAQVYANLFSNAVKYTQEIIDHQGQSRKAVTYGREIIADFFGPAKPGIKFNVFTTGPHLSREEADFMFSEGGRARNSQFEEGSGHGLAFIKHVVELHGGKVGYEATNQGNNFYFILPMPAAAPLAAADVLEEAEESGRERRRGPHDRRRKGGGHDRRRKGGGHDRRRRKRR